MNNLTQDPKRQRINFLTLHYLYKGEPKLGDLHGDIFTDLYNDLLADTSIDIKDVNFTDEDLRMHLSNTKVGNLLFETR